MKYINKRCLAIAGAGMLFLGLSGSMQALPFSMSHQFDRGRSVFSSKHSGHDSRWNHSAPDRGDDRINFYDQVGCLQADAGVVKGVKDRKPISTPNETVADTCPGSLAVVVPVANPSNVPDGGTTAIMLGASMIGLVFMRRKLSA